MAEKPMKIEGNRRLERRPVNEEGAGRGVPQNLLIIGGVIALAVIAGITWLVLRGGGESENNLAAMELGRLTDLLDQGEYAKAIEGDPTIVIDGQPMRGLRAIVAEYDGTRAGKAAALQLGEAYLATDKPSEAAVAYRVAAESDEDLVRAAALAGLASVAEAEGNFAEAAARYDEAAALYGAEDTHADLIRPLYLFAAAKNYENAEEKEAAIERYREIAMRYPSSEQNSVARFALARYGIEI